MGTILIVDDDTTVGRVLATLLKQEGHQAVCVSAGEAALEVLAKGHFDIVLSDIRMPGMDGLDLLARIRQEYPGTPVVLMTAHGSIPLAVDAMKRGAVDFLLKPCDREELAFVVTKAIASVSRDLPPSVLPSQGADLMLDQSTAMQRVWSTVRKVASTTATVLIRGETGTGKERVARAIHELSGESSRPFIAVNCGALPENLLESELFGYEKGAFSGAVTRKPGRIELAHRGTLFLDEIGDISPATQVKLLRVLQERSFERLGGTQSIHVQMRVIAATHRPLEKLVEQGQFREDLFYRLNVIPIEVPPLRQRGEDLTRLAEQFCDEFAKANGRCGLRFDHDALQALYANPWPGNVRQLQNVTERLVILADGTSITGAEVERELPMDGTRGAFGMPMLEVAGSLSTQRMEAERAALLDTLARAGNNRTLAARLLNVSRRTLYNKLSEHGLK